MSHRYSYCGVMSSKNIESHNKNTAAELLNFVKTRKAYWLVPLLAMIFIIGVFTIVMQSSAVSPFFYALF